MSIEIIDFGFAYRKAKSLLPMVPFLIIFLGDFSITIYTRGIAPNVVMKWTGHSDYKAMKPYIDIVDSIRAKEMTKMDFMDD